MGPKWINMWWSLQIAKDEAKSWQDCESSLHSVIDMDQIASQPSPNQEMLSMESLPSPSLLPSNEEVESSLLFSILSSNEIQQIEPLISEMMQEIESLDTETVQSSNSEMEQQIESLDTEMVQQSSNSEMVQQSSNSEMVQQSSNSEMVQQSSNSEMVQQSSNSEMEHKLNH
ncbi:hypothetical protein TNCT_24281 [Trichonephila clavata]|uniref:Uncharacterized protein n=1 Tax=Trichonephila clavata TaxID=2740835 RepID=A0A8X6I2A0_TRICU|nr:hypothetical protein TNCT_24281 [Trichonephila clavata]